ncbi:MAG: tetratricopeptide repeat protein [Sulfuricellaceae bacterium]
MHSANAIAEIPLDQADLLRKKGRWAEAAQRYADWLARNPASTAVVLNFALCLLVLQRFAAASQQALRIPEQDSLYWRAQIIHARAQMGLGAVDAALASLNRALAHDPTDADIALELADVLLHQVGDAAGARRLVTPFISGSAYRESALQTYIVASLYDREESDIDLAWKIREFANTHLNNGVATAQRTPGPASRSGKMRVGLISGYFCSAPVYFLTYGILEQLAQRFDLVFYDRGSKKDWANNKFRAIAREWVDVDRANTAKLSQTLHAGCLDLLLEMSGWSDVDVLKAIADKPCPRIYKWVGGQSATTGMNIFDGFISDRIQTPPETQGLYAEPLLNLPNGYTAYTPPDYLPHPVPARRDVLLLGVIGNPAKVSTGFLTELALTVRRAAAQMPVPIVIQFIDARYGKALVRSRIAEFLRPSFEGSKRVAVLFTHPQSHKDFLVHVSKLSAVVDTWPYSAGLTALEALAMDVPVLGRAGMLCSSRHAASHHYFATPRRPLHEFTVANLRALHKAAARPRSTQGFRKSLRNQPQKIAESLEQILLREYRKAA